MILAVLLMLAGCAEPTHITVPEPDVRPSSGISLDGFSFYFPVGLTFEGATENCPNKASECPLGDDSTHAVWRSGDLRFDYVLDPFGKALENDQWGDPVTINGRPAFRKLLEDGGTRYLITNHYAGAESAAIAIWHQPEEPLFWGTCRSDEDCEAVLQTLASVAMRSAEQECALMFPQPPREWVPPPGYREDASVIPPPPAPVREAGPPAPPPPPAPRPADADKICKDHLDET
ncbi:hypothetical protein GRI44_13200 [Altererythrobacter confluentis]|uniref:Uncharacterized protein n=1 Tax=Allopontixanthobacter confluentis TaxID=1849021 RepID=A0A6L7GJM0_9SPHN|nr:hypothetical protein [Allopontixanthobacter confluentis]MXP15706.1 hypothetical protein [Allopontixanthobacter confluentis]